ncbi:hypothetical protein HPT25_09705 [Bacillus sp. BRMEA1]|uniref:hypothetical protein n=1 Tax=Neobacillus endophyticus TaxID=2738405 RepID=UPI001566CE88|nr:hypothetical protein [Neobacillus endophyticus]NRD77719.1 hypothetical protein [Neobacillus endophyticus]
MKHYAYNEWVKYIKNEVDEQVRLELEEHLYTCNQCLDLYLQAIAFTESSFPMLTNESSFTDRVMSELSTNKKAASTAGTSYQPNRQANNRKPFYQQVLFHYLLAAAATILLTFSGAFQSLAKYANFIEIHDLQRKQPSVTAGVINKTFGWMDSIEKKEAVKK